MRRRMLLSGMLFSLLLGLASQTPAPTRAADPLDEATYAAWASDHAARLLAALQLPDEFTLADLRDLVARLSQLVDEARVVEPPPRYAAAHAAYRDGLEAVDRVRELVAEVVLTRQPVPALADALFDAGQRVAQGLLQLRAVGVSLPPEVLALFEMGTAAAPPAPTPTGTTTAPSTPAPAAAPPAASDTTASAALSRAAAAMLARAPFFIAVPRAPQLQGHRAVCFLEHKPSRHTSFSRPALLRCVIR
ncbi:MAG TPA: hypothetical protein VFB73_06835 [Chloroflexota bacterium]|nr:hypothetical protein [Chloroflexota bacterium]